MLNGFDIDLGNSPFGEFLQQRFNRKRIIKIGTRIQFLRDFRKDEKEKGLK